MEMRGHLLKISIVMHYNGHWMHYNALDVLYWEHWKHWKHWKWQKFKYIENMTWSMGLLELFRNKSEYHLTNKRVRSLHSQIQDAFATVHDNVSGLHNSFIALHTGIAQQKEWLQHLHQNHIIIQDEHNSHKKMTQNEFSSLKSWVSFLHKGQQKQEKHLLEFQKCIEQTMKSYSMHLAEIKEALEKAHNMASKAEGKEPVREEIDYDVVKEAVMHDFSINLDVIRTQVKQELYETLASQLDEQHTKHIKEVRDVFAKTSVIKTPVTELAESVIIEKIKPEVKDVPTVGHLTNPEQKLLNLLMNENDPLSYIKISQLTGHSINTIRVNMNILKKKSLIEESTLPNGVKLFSVTPKEKVRKMYNLHVL